MSNRDWQVLYLVDQHRYLTTHHLQTFVFTGHASPASAARSARRVLRRLERDGLIRCLPRRRGGLLAGSAPATWQLAPAGARLVHQNGERYRTRVPSLWHLRHCLALADIHLQLRAISANSGRTVEVAVEHQAQRRYTGLGGETLWLKPDLEATIRGTDEHGPYIDRWFIEVDLGTESLPTLERKCLAYETYRRSGREQADCGVFPLVLWVMAGPHAEARHQALGKVVAGSSRLTPELYRFAQLEDPPSLVEILGATS